MKTKKRNKMRIVVQRVKEAKVEVEGNVVGKIDEGFLVLLGVTHKDTKEQADYLAKKLCKLRVFRDENDKMNLDIQKIGGEIMLVSNFTLYGRTKGANRPDFTHSAKPELAEKIYNALIDQLQKFVPTKTGVFRTHMDIEMTADGPGTFLIEEYSTTDAVY